ncbi:hypothetical protein, partial [Nonomuraea rubra]|uniref:hypothetical protein n=1 Tax=Nonomuraea rubra TaxID=46180 RepID=UPI0031EE973A
MARRALRGQFDEQSPRKFVPAGGHGPTSTRPGGRRGCAVVRDGPWGLERGGWVGAGALGSQAWLASGALGEANVRARPW